MPLEAPDHQYWKAAVGYVELGMFQEANDQLENVDPFNRAAPEVLAVRIAIYQGLELMFAFTLLALRCVNIFYSKCVRGVESFRYGR